MRASRLLQILLILQNRGRQTARQLAGELEVTPRTILRDVDAMTEAGLPIIVFQGNRGGIELGFNYRTRLTGLARDEAEALGIILGARHPIVGAVGLEQAATRAVAKLVESFPDTVRDTTQVAMARFTVAQSELAPDPRIAALALAIREQRIVRLRAATDGQTVHPIGLDYRGAGWQLREALTTAPIPDEYWGDINISAHRF